MNISNVPSSLAFVLWSSRSWRLQCFSSSSRPCCSNWNGYPSASVSYDLNIKIERINCPRLPESFHVHISSRRNNDVQRDIENVFQNNVCLSIGSFDCQTHWLQSETDWCDELTGRAAFELPLSESDMSDNWTEGKSCNRDKHWWNTLCLCLHNTNVSFYRVVIICVVGKNMPQYFPNKIWKINHLNLICLSRWTKLFRD